MQHHTSAVARRCWRPSRLVLPVFALQAVWQVAADTLPLIAQIRHGNALLLLASITWLAQQAVAGVAQGIVAQHPVDVVDNLNARRVHTQTRLLARTLSFMVVMAGLSGLTTACPWSRCAKRPDLPAKPPSSGTSGCVCCR